MSTGWDAVTDLTNSDNSLIKETATKASAYKDSLDNGQMTKTEFNDAMSDLLSLQNIQNATLDLEQEIVVKKAFETISEVVLTLE